jgi:hypothetical protein
MKGEADALAQASARRRWRHYRLYGDMERADSSVYWSRRGDDPSTDYSLMLASEFGVCGESAVGFEEQIALDVEA